MSQNHVLSKDESHDSDLGSESKPKMLASTAESTPAPLVPSTRGSSELVAARKNTYVLPYGHLLGKKLEEGLRDKVLAILDTMQPVCWTSVNYVAVGYTEESSIPTILITVNVNKLSVEEAERVAKEVKKECIEFELSDVEAVVAEGTVWM